MSYGTEGYYRNAREAERVAAMLRSLVQDATRDFKKEAIDILFPKKMVDEIDIGVICSRWVKTIMCSLKNIPEKQVKLTMFIWCRYKQGINVDSDELWHLIWMREGLPLFSSKINELPAAGKVAPMGSLEKPEKIGRDIKTVRW